MMQFQGFKPEAMPKIANSLGYQGDMQGFQQYLDQNEDKKRIMDQYMKKAEEMARGGSVQRFAGGGTPNPAALPQQTIPKLTLTLVLTCNKQWCSKLLVLDYQ
jgi:hypothetical protein